MDLCLISLLSHCCWIGFQSRCVQLPKKSCNWLHRAIDFESWECRTRCSLCSTTWSGSPLCLQKGTITWHKPGRRGVARVRSPHEASALPLTACASSGETAELRVHSSLRVQEFRLLSAKLISTGAWTCQLRFWQVDCVRASCLTTRPCASCASIAWAVNPCMAAHDLLCSSLLFAKMAPPSLFTKSSCNWLHRALDSYRDITRTSRRLGLPAVSFFEWSLPQNHDTLCASPSEVDQSLSASMTEHMKVAMRAVKNTSVKTFVSISLLLWEARATAVELR